MISSINCKGRLLDFQEPRIMGIINATPDSFFNRGRNSSLDDALVLAEQMLEQGAAILDVGGQSSRPGAEPVGTEEEIERVVPLIAALTKRFPDAYVSVDTYRAAVARAAVEAGAVIVNDISAGLLDEKMFQTISDLKVSYIMMHMQGDPKSMQDGPKYDDVVVDVLDLLRSRLQLAAEFGIEDVIIDSGFGFGKTLEQNYSLLRNLPTFKILDKPVLVGLSRKSMIYRPLGVEAEDALNGTSVLNTLALEHGADILRVHDVRTAMEVLKLHKLFRSA